MMDLYNFIKVGAQVRWNDPENGLSSGVYEIICTPEVIEDDSIILIASDYSEAEVYPNELEPIK